MDCLAHELEVAVEAWDAAGLGRPRALVVSGSGLAVDLLPDLASDRHLLQEILPFPLHSIEGHPLSVELLGAGTGRPIVYQRGRIHGYQGYTAAQVVFHVRLARLLGAERLLMTNAAGSLSQGLAPGSLVMIRDQINLMGTNPLAGSPPEAWGPRFPDLTDAYDPESRQRLAALAAQLGIRLAEGVYAGVAGPSFETPAEVAMLRRVGADLVGMSTVLEVIAARHMGMRCQAVSMVSNYAAGISESELDHAEVLEAGRAVADDLTRLLEALLYEWLEA